MDWFRWHHGTVTDRKWPRIASRAGTTVANVIAVWAAILESASQAESRGYAFLSDDDAEDLDAALGMPADTTRKVISELCARGMIDGENRLAAWDKRQPKREREDNSAERVRKFRERLASQGNAGQASSEPSRADFDNVTPCNAAVTEETPRGEEIREEEIREEKSKEPKQRSPKGSRLPTDWMPSSDQSDWAKRERPGLDIRSQAERFRDYWTAKPGKDGVKLDWGATWRNWIRNARPDNPTTVNGTRHETHRNLSAVERVRASAISGELADRDAYQPNGRQNLVGPDGGDLRPPLDIELWGGREP